MARRRTTSGPVKGTAGVELKRGDAVTVDGKPGRITGFTRDGASVYVRFDEKGAGRFPRFEVELA